MLPFLLGATHSPWCEYRHCDEPHGQNRRCSYIAYDMIIPGKNATDLYSTGKKIIMPSPFVENIDRLSEWEYLSKYYIEMFQIMDTLSTIVDETETLNADVTRNPILALSFNPNSLPYPSWISRNKRESFSAHGRISGCLADQIADKITICLQNPFFGQKTNYIASGNTEHTTMKRLYIRPWLIQFHQKITKLFYDTTIMGMRQHYHTKHQREIEKLYGDLEFLKIEVTDLKNEKDESNSATDTENSALRESKLKLKQRVKCGKQKFGKLSNEHDALIDAHETLQKDYDKLYQEMRALKGLPEEEVSQNETHVLEVALTEHQEIMNEQGITQSSASQSTIENEPTEEVPSPINSHSSEDEKPTINKPQAAAKKPATHSKRTTRKKGKNSPKKGSGVSHEDLLLEARIQKNMEQISVLLNSYENEAKSLLAELNKQFSSPKIDPLKTKNLSTTLHALCQKIKSLVDSVPQESELAKHSVKLMKDLASDIRNYKAKQDLFNQSLETPQALSSTVEKTETIIVHVDPLIAAAAEGNDISVRLFLIGGFCPNIGDKNWYTPLHHASQNGHLDVVKTLLHYKANVDAKTIDLGWTPLHLATKSGHLLVVKKLLRSNADIHAVNAKGLTSLHIASAHSYLQIVRTLINCGANINALANRKMPPLLMAASWKYDLKESSIDPMPVAKILIDAGADETIIPNRYADFKEKVLAYKNSKIQK